MLHLTSPPALNEPSIINHKNTRQGMDTYSNILFVKEAFGPLSHLAHRLAVTDKFTPEACCVIGNYYSLKVCERERERVMLCNVMCEGGGQKVCERERAGEFEAQSKLGLSLGGRLSLVPATQRPPMLVCPHPLCLSPHTTTQPLNKNTGSARAQCRVVPACAAPVPHLPVCLDTHGPRICGDEEPLCSHRCEMECQAKCVCGCNSFLWAGSRKQHCSHPRP